MWSRDTMCPGNLESFYFVLIKPDHRTKARVYYNEAEIEYYHTNFWQAPLGLVITFLAIKKRHEGFQILIEIDEDDTPYLREYTDSYLGHELSIQPYNRFSLYKQNWRNGKTVMVYDETEYKYVPIYEYFVDNTQPPYVALCIHKGAWSLIFIL
ncbi:MAG: hypothetical protein QW815_01775 [Nitrososphaerota archaeon]